MKKLPLLIPCLVLAALSLGCRNTASSDRRHVAVFVNGEPVFHRDVVAETDRWIDSNKARDAAKGLLFEESGRDVTRDILRRDVLEALIERKLIAQRLKADNLTVSDEEVSAELAARAQQMGQTLNEAAESIAAQGKSLATVREKLRWHTLGVQKLYEAHAADKQNLTEADALRMYNEYPAEFDQEEKRRVSHILIRVSPDANESTRASKHEKAARLLERIRTGENFGALAREFSEDELSRDRGGDRGFSGRGIVRGPGDDPFGDAAFAMKQAGDVSDVVTTSDGFHIIKLTDVRPARRLAFAEVKDKIIQDFRHREIGRFWEEFGGELRARANLDWTSHELFRQAEAKRRQEKHNERIERMIAREQRKTQDAQQKESAARPEPQLRTEAR